MLLTIKSSLVYYVTWIYPLVNSDALKDLCSQIVKEACVNMSCLVVHLRVDLSTFIELILPHLVALLPNSAKVMASLASVCTKIIIKVLQSL